MTGWSIVVTAPHRERAVAQMLTAFDVPFHLFQELRQQVWRGRIIAKPFPVFPGYVFCLPGLWDRVRSICGVLGFVRFGERHAVVDGATVEELVKASINDVFPLRAVRAVSRFRAGDRVRIQGTSLWAGHAGVFLRMLIPQKAVIDIDIFGRLVAIPIDEQDLELVAPRRRHRRRRRGSAPSGKAVTLNSVAIAA
jgi:transcription antitermination factor NusG